MRRLWDVVLSLMQDRARNPCGLFNAPVVDVPGYAQVITRPMDLGTIKSRLEDGFYARLGVLGDFASDVRLVFHNARLFNPPGDLVHRFASELEHAFDCQLDAALVMERKKAEEKEPCCCSICHQGELPLTQASLVQCSACDGRIPEGAEYYRLGGNDRGQHWCLKCHAALPAHFVGLVGQRVDKLEQLVKLRNARDETTEPWDSCGQCGKWAHVACVAVEGCCCTTSPAALVLPPECALSRFIQLRVRRHVDAFSSSPLAVHCRVLSDCEFDGSSNDGGGARLQRWVDFQAAASGRTTATHYSKRRRRERCIALVQDDVLCFALYVQEYYDDDAADSSCVVYISYLDSCGVLLPREARGPCYQQCMTAYFAWMQQKTRRRQAARCVYLWASPPAEGDAYVFNAHPFWQRNPTPERLKKWYAAVYKQCLDQAIFKPRSKQGESTLFDKHLLAFYKPDEGKRLRTRRSAARPPSLSTSQYVASAPRPAFALDGFPLFQGDYCQVALEIILCDKLERQQESVDDADGVEARIRRWWRLVWGECAVIETTEDGGGFVVKPSSQLAPTADTAHELELDTGCTFHDRDEWLMRQLASVIRPQKDSFLVYEFEDDTVAPGKRAKTEEDQEDEEEDACPNLVTVFSHRLEMLDYLYANRLHFDSRRRAKYATRVLLQRLHQPLVS